MLKDNIEDDRMLDAQSKKPELWFKRIVYATYIVGFILISLSFIVVNLNSNNDQNFCDNSIRHWSVIILPIMFFLLAVFIVFFVIVLVNYDRSYKKVFLIFGGVSIFIMTVVTFAVLVSENLHSCD